MWFGGLDRSLGLILLSRKRYRRWRLGREVCVVCPDIGLRLGLGVGGRWLLRRRAWTSQKEAELVCNLLSLTAIADLATFPRLIGSITDPGGKSPTLIQQYAGDLGSYPGLTAWLINIFYVASCTVDVIDVHEYIYLKNLLNWNMYMRSLGNSRFKCGDFDSLLFSAISLESYASCSRHHFASRS